jgi:hypothetical protein
MLAPLSSQNRKNVKIRYGTKFYFAEGYALLWSISGVELFCDAEIVVADSQRRCHANPRPS